MSKTKPCGHPNFAMEFAMIGDTVMEKVRNRKLNLSAVKVLLYLSRNRDISTGKLHDKDSNFPNRVKDIAQYWGMSIRAVRYAVQDLIEADLYVPPNRTGIETIEGVLLPNSKDKIEKGGK